MGSLHYPSWNIPHHEDGRASQLSLWEAKCRFLGCWTASHPVGKPAGPHKHCTSAPSYRRVSIMVESVGSKLNIDLEASRSFRSPKFSKFIFHLIKATCVGRQFLLGDQQFNLPSPLCKDAGEAAFQATRDCPCPRPTHLQPHSWQPHIPQWAWNTACYYR